MSNEMITKIDWTKELIPVLGKHARLEGRDDKLNLWRVEAGGTKFYVDDYGRIVRNAIMNPKIKKIPFNIWDDYDDSSSETNGFVEEYYNDECEEYIQVENTKEICSFISDFIKSLKIPKIETSVVEENLRIGDSFKTFQINFKNLTHEKRYELIELLEKSKLSYQGIPIDFYSES